MDNEFIFIAGLHRSGTSVLHEIIRSHKEITGFHNTGVPEDEGQHLQSVYKPASAFGGPGRFAFNPKAYMDDSHPLATQANRRTIINQWGKYLDFSCKYIVEKSPPNLIRTRFIQKIFPNSRFIVIFRHPVAISYATKKWTFNPIIRLIDHAIYAYETFLKDMPYLQSVYILRYEDFVRNPQNKINEIFDYLGLSPVKIERSISPNINEKYFSMWEKDRNKLLNKILWGIGGKLKKYEARANRLGYSLYDYNNLIAMQWYGINHNRIT